jgi:hypothetical protein
VLLVEHTARFFSPLDFPSGSGSELADGNGPGEGDHLAAEDPRSHPDTCWRDHVGAFPAAATALGYTGVALASGKADPQPGLSLGLGNLGAEVTLSVLYALPQGDELLATLDGQQVPPPPALPDGNANAGEPASPADVQAPGVGELVVPTPAWAVDPFLALQEFLGGPEGLRHSLATTLNGLLHSPWVAVSAGALAAAEVYRRRARRADRRLYPPIHLPEITGPSGWT